MSSKEKQDSLNKYSPSPNMYTCSGTHSRGLRSITARIIAKINKYLGRHDSDHNDRDDFGGGDGYDDRRLVPVRIPVRVGCLAGIMMTMLTLTSCDGLWMDMSDGDPNIGVSVGTTIGGPYYSGWGGYWPGDYWPGSWNGGWIGQGWNGPGWSGPVPPPRPRPEKPVGPINPGWGGNNNGWRPITGGTTAPPASQRPGDMGLGGSTVIPSQRPGGMGNSVSGNSSFGNTGTGSSDFNSRGRR